MSRCYAAQTHVCAAFMNAEATLHLRFLDTSQALQHVYAVSCGWVLKVLEIALQVPSKESLPSDEDLAKEVVSVLSGVNVLEFNIKMLMKHLSKHFCTLFANVSWFGAVTCLTSIFSKALIAVCLQMVNTR